MNIANKIRNIFKPKSSKYWDSRYNQGGNSGAGSYGLLANFKKKIIEEFCKSNSIQSFMEFGSGDGNQISLLDLDINYIGLDISQSAIDLCNEKFKNDSSKTFILFDGKKGFCKKKQLSADLTMSLDVIYHLIEDDVYENYMHELFSASKKYVIVYSSNDEKINDSSWHVKHRNFTKDVMQWFPSFKMVKKIQNEYPVGNQIGVESSADFYFFERD
jgi:hypothetical protein